MSDDRDTAVGSASIDGPSDDSVTETRSTSWLGRLAGSLVGALIGIVLFLASFVLLTWNEGNVVAEIASLDSGASVVLPVPADAVDPARNGRLVHVTGMATAAAPLRDPTFRVGGAGLLRLRRVVEMYQWHEEEESRTEKRLGGGETTTTTYRYAREWTDKPIDSARFKRVAGHENPAMTLRTGTYTAEGPAVGAFRLDAALTSRLDDFQPMALTPESLASAALGGFRQSGDILYRGTSPDRPQVGDLRVRFEAVTLQPISAVAAQIDGTLAPFRSKNDRMISLIELGTHGHEAMFKEARDDARLLAWILRGVGFVMMLVGLLLATGPIAWLVSVVPFLEGLFGAAAFIMALLLAVPLTLITIAIAWLAYRPLLAGGLVLAGLLLAFAIRRLAPRRNRAAAAAARA